MRTKVLAAAALGLAVVTGVGGAARASPQFLTYEGRDAVHQGRGGEKKLVDGIEFWVEGDPPHRFQVLGIITDRRMKTGIYGAIRMSGLDIDIARTAKAAGGDGVILGGQRDDLLGVGGFGSAYGTGGQGWASAFGSTYSAPIEARESRYVVVKYLPDSSDAPPAPLLPPTPPTEPPPPPQVDPSPPPPAVQQAPPAPPRAPPRRSSTSNPIELNSPY